MGRHRHGLLACLSSFAALGACSSLPHLDPPVASYGASNVFSPSGYSETKVDDTHYQVKATGTEGTPTARLEKIARARAAEIGVEGHLKYFKVTSVQPSLTCAKKQAGYKSQTQPPSGRPVVVVDVTYANEALDAGFASSAESFQALNSQIGGEVVAPEASAAAIQETRAGCGQG
jgi:hypothetical protein